MASELQGERATEIPPLYTWRTLKNISDLPELLGRYHQGLRELSERPELLGPIFAKPQSKMNAPAKLHDLINVIDSEKWSSFDVDVNGEVYE
jgi:type I restriction enzyme M protein